MNEKKSTFKKIVSLGGIVLLLIGITAASIYLGPSINYEDKNLSKSFFDKHYSNIKRLDIDFVKYSKVNKVTSNGYVFSTDIVKNMSNKTVNKTSDNICTGEQQFIIDIKLKKLLFVEDEVKEFGLKKSYEAAESCLNYLFVNRN